MKFYLRVVATALLLSACGFSIGWFGPNVVQKVVAAQAAVAESKPQPARGPIGVIALSDALEVTKDNPDGFHPSIVNGPRATRGQNCVWFVEGAADQAKAYGCDCLIIWTSFGGSRTNEETGFNLNLLDAAAGVTLADARDCSAAIHARGLRAGIGVSPLMVVQGVNRPRWDASNPVGTLLFEISLAQANGYDDFYVDSPRGEDIAINNTALEPDRLAPIFNRFAGSRFLMEFWLPGYGEFGNVCHWRDSAKTFTADRPQGVELEPEAVKAPAQQAAWGKRLRDTNSTIIVNCRPDDPTLPERQAPVLAAWRASRERSK
jgi:hypothetical protein